MKPLFEGLDPKYIGEPFKDVDKWVAEMKAALKQWYKVHQNIGSAVEIYISELKLKQAIKEEAKSAKQKMDS